MLVEDFSAFFNTVEFATAGTLNGVAVRGIFDNGFEEQPIALGFGGTNPLYTLASSAVPSGVIGMSLVIGATTYKVVESMPDGTGITRLQLRA